MARARAFKALLRDPLLRPLPFPTTTQHGVSHWTKTPTLSVSTRTPAAAFVVVRTRAVRDSSYASPVCLAARLAAIYTRPLKRSPLTSQPLTDTASANRPPACATIHHIFTSRSACLRLSTTHAASLSCGTTLTAPAFFQPFALTRAPGSSSPLLHPKTQPTYHTHYRLFNLLPALTFSLRSRLASSSHNISHPDVTRAENAWKHD
jgi:hypothetical protein